MGRYPRAQHDGGRHGPPGDLERQGRDERQVEGAARYGLEREPRRGRREDLPRDQQRQPPEPRDHGRQGCADVLPRVRRPVPVAGRDRQAGVGRQRLARRGHLLVAGGRREAALLRHEPRGADQPRHRGFHGWRQRRSVPGRGPQGPHRRGRRLEARHEEGAGRVPALHGELVAGDRAGSRLRRDLERARQQRRGRPRAEGAQLRRGEQGDRQGRLAGRFPGRGHPARAVGVPGPRPGCWSPAGALPRRGRLALRVRGPNGGAALEVRPEPQGRRVAEDPELRRVDARVQRGPGVHERRPGPGPFQRRGIRVLHRSHAPRATSRTRAASGSTTRSAAPSRPPRSPTAWSTSPISAGPCTAWTRARVSPGGPST